MNDWDFERKMSDWNANLEMNAKKKFSKRNKKRRSIWLTNDSMMKNLMMNFDHLIDEEQMIWSKSDDYTYWTVDMIWWIIWKNYSDDLDSWCYHLLQCALYVMIKECLLLSIYALLFMLANFY